jgi:UDP-N-acetylmuramoyl-L-alanyl-D-glutamate--2,6-diaminopimelate ligase
VKPGYLFAALKGVAAHGRDFVGKAVENGAVAVLSAGDLGAEPRVAHVRAENPRRAFALAASRLYPKRPATIVAVTGTNGKSSTVDFLRQIWAHARRSAASLGTLGAIAPSGVIDLGHTTPDPAAVHATLTKLADEGVTHAAMEASSHGLDQHRVDGLVFDAAAFTNLTQDHLDYHADMDAYFAAKRRLFTDFLKASVKPRKTAVVYGGDPRGADLLGSVRAAGLDAWSYGEDRQWDIHPVEVHSDVSGLRGQLKVRGRDLHFSSRLIGAANLQNIMAAVAVGEALELTADAISKGIQQLTSVPGRLEKVDNHLGVSVLVDYAHTPDAFEKVLRAVRPLTQGRLVMVFGCGGDRDRGKRPLMGEIAARLSDLLVVTSDNPRTEDPLRILAEIEPGIRRAGLSKLDDGQPQASRGYWMEPDRRAAIRVALGAARRGDVVLIAGKGHEDYQILGTTKIHFDDREVAREELRRISNA